MSQFILCKVIRSSHGDCSNGGVSGRHDALVLTDSFQSEYLGIPCVRPDAITLGMRTTPRASVLSGPVDQIGPMSGGAKIHSEDPRFEAMMGTSEPVMLLDRYETTAEYARQW